MNSRFTFSSSPAARRRAAFERAATEQRQRRRRVAGLTAVAATVATFAGVFVARAQEARPGPNGARFPRVHHDAQNTGRALDELYQGVTQGNVGAFQTPQNRTGTFDVDGWGFPFGAANALTPGTFVLRPYVLLDDFPAGTQPAQPPQILGGFVAADPGWATVTGPSVEAQNATYARIRAKDRETDEATTPDAFFTWQPTIPGAAGTITRLAISVYIPSPPPNPVASDPTTQETRINDAEYLVTCQAGANGATVTIPVRASQEGGGWRTLTDAAGQVLFFPFLVPANGQFGPNAQVRLSSKTSNDLTATTYVIADAIRFVQQFDSIQAAPTVTPRHGGRRVAAAGVQPATGSAYQAGAFSGYDPATNAIGIQASETPGDFSTLFQGPESFITPNPTPPGRPTNNTLYGAPIFSQMQVIVARTEYVPDPNDPLGSIQVGAVYGFDWLTGAPVWRFPDRTYLPQGGVKNLETYAGAYGAGVRNGVANLRVGPGGSGQSGQLVRQPAIPGIGAIDKNGDGTIQDDEVFIVGSGINVARRTGQTTLRPGQPLDTNFVDEALGTTSGALLSSVTIVPDAVVEGVVSIPRAGGTATNEGPGRYYTVGTDATGAPTALPVVRPVAYVAANNGVVYAIDPYGNSDGRYANPDPARPNPQATDLGTFRPGTTNVLWTFNAVSGPQGRRGTGTGPVESDITYNKRLKGEVPATEGFGTSAPTAAYNRPRNPVFTGDAQPSPINPLLDEQRLFVGNENGYVYALDSKAVNPPSLAAPTAPGALPVRKGDADANAGNIPSELRWWFEARGAVTGTPAVSQSLLDAGANLGPSRGVYFTTAEGRVYCVDWEGPVSKPAAAGNTPIRRNWDGVVGSDAALRLNDGWRFRNRQPARDPNIPGDNNLPPTVGRSPDDTDGTIRPRWTFPQRFVDVDGADNKISNADTADSVLARDANNRPVSSKLAAPVTLGAFSGSASLLEFSARRTDGTLANLHYVLVAANDPASEAPTTGKVYLLDMAGDRTSFLTNPTRNAANRAVPQPFDRFDLGGPVGTATPTWTYRFLYGDDAGRNNLTNLLPGDGPTPFLVTRPAEVVPSRRLMPTVFVGGVGRLFALDLDFDTAVFQRWPTNKNDIPGPKPRNAAGDIQNDLIPPALTDDAVAALGTPTRPDAALPGTALAYADLARPVFARTYSLLGDDGGVVSSLVVTGGPLQSRGGAPAAPPLPTNDPGGYNNVTTTGTSRPTQVEQNILDPRTQDDPSGNPGDAPTAGADELAVGFQYPALWVSTQSGQLHEISTNIEGEDRSTETDAFFGESSALGWAYTTDPSRQNDQHVQLDRYVGPGGAGGVAIISNVYFEGLDPDYRNPDPATGPYPPGQPPLTPRALAATDDSTGDAGFPLDGNGLLYDPTGPAANQTGTIRAPRELGANDDNPLASRVTWIYSGGPDGVMYAFTPVARGSSSGGVPGQRAGGFNNIRQNPQLSGDPKVDIFDAEDFNALLQAAQGGTPIRPDRDGSLGAGGTTIRSRAAKGKNNFFEWGETIYIVAYDLNAVTGTTDPAYTDALASNAGPNSVTITVTNLLNGQPVLTRATSIQTKTGSNDPATYLGNNPRFFGQGGPTASPAIPFGLAFFAVRLDGSGPQQPQTPGRPLQVRVTQQVLQKILSPGGTVTGTRRVPLDARGTGPNGRAVLNYLLPQFMIANPIAVEGFLTDTVGRRATVINTDGQKNVIGPFFNGLNGTAVDDTQKGRVITDRFTTSPTGTGANQTPTAGTEDPDKNDFSYSQALANGNLIARYDLRPYRNALPGTSSGTALERNPGRGQRVINDPDFYVPVAAGTGYVGHGSTGSTDQTPTVRNLSVFNRSRLVGLPRVRVTRDELQWRFWPGQLPNADADDTLNPRAQPSVMSFTGVINPLPWEEAPSETKPWKQGNAAATSTGDAGADANRSQDYPNVDRGQISATAGRAGGDPTTGPATLPFQGGSGTGQTFALRGTPAVGLGVNIKMPIHQPANLVANGSLTSTYVGPNPADAPTGGGATTAALASGVIGPVQLPRGLNSRVIRAANPGGGVTATSPITITPWGYTARLLVYVDSNGDGKFDRGTQNTVTAAGGVDPNNPDISRQSNIEEACREVEVWVGVPADIRMKSVEEVVDLTAALGLPHGFGQQNGLLGYVGDGADPLGLGFGPPPLTLAYDNFFKTANVRNDGNVNLWNVRAARRAAVLQGTTFAERFLQMRSNLVDQKFYVSAFGRDPLVTAFGKDPITGNPYGPGGLAPNLVTSLDEPYDDTWNTRTGLAGYPASYAGFSGRHTLHKARPGQQQGTLLSLPDSPDNAPVPPNLTFAPRVGISIPIGTPSGVYSSRLQFFEDHDTPDPRTSAGVADLLAADPTTGFPIGVRAYHPAPFLSASGVIAPAGPLYGGRNDIHPGDGTQPGVSKRKIFPADLEGVWRPRGAVQTPNNPPVPQYLPATDPATTLKATVVEGQLTGQTPDNRVNPLTGLLPSVDLFSLVDPQDGRASAAVAPAAFRSAFTGVLHVYFSRSASDGSILNPGDARPGQPLRLFRSRLNWDLATGTWKAANFGTPLNAGAENTNTGRWFTAPQFVTPPLAAAPGLQNAAPFVLHEVTRDDDGRPANENAVLYWINTEVVPGGAPINRIVYAPVNNLTTGELGTARPFLNPERFDPSARRLGPRVVTMGGPSITSANERSQVVVLYYGGAAGRSALFYSAAQDTNHDGVPDGNGYGGPETPLPIPAAIASATDPVGVARFFPQGARTPGLENQQSQWALDVYYSGVSRANQNADVYMTRYRARNGGRGIQLDAVPLPRIEGEQLQSPTREPVWVSQHVSWLRIAPQGTNPDERPVVRITYRNGGGVTTLPGAGQNWQYDDASGQLFTSYTRVVGGRTILNVVYADTSAGTLRFRGEAIPTSADIVRLDYTPQTYRITQDSASDVAPIAFSDDTVLASTTNDNTRNEVLRRPNGALPTNRQWIVWQKGARADQPASLYYNTRRVGIDLRKLVNTPMRDDESIELGLRDPATGNQAFVNLSVTGPTGANIPFDADFANGRIFFAASLDGVEVGPTTANGLAIRVDVVRLNPDGTINNRRTLNPVGRLALIDDTVTEETGANRGRLLSRTAINEGQPIAFSDAFDGNAALPDNQKRIGDPTLPPGRVWLFWTSPRARTYDIFWQTLAPNFESFSLSGFGATNP